MGGAQAGVTCNWNESGGLLVGRHSGPRGGFRGRDVVAQRLIWPQRGFYPGAQRRFYKRVALLPRHRVLLAYASYVPVYFSGMKYKHLLCSICILSICKVEVIVFRERGLVSSCFCACDSI